MQNTREAGIYSFVVMSRDPDFEVILDVYKCHSGDGINPPREEISRGGTGTSGLARGRYVKGSVTILGNTSAHSWKIHFK